MLSANKPRLLFIRFPYAGLPEFVLRHLAEQVSCLQQCFEVTVADNPVDYDEICTTHQPDLVLIESGVYTNHSPALGNTNTHPQVPKMGFIHCDAYCRSRDYALADMERWGIETCFTTAVSLPDYTPTIRDHIFVWPNFVDSAVYHDYGLPKIVPVLFTGSQDTHYPWRRRVNNLVSQHYPSLQSPHHGWFSAEQAARMWTGEDYARLVNAAYFVPACGTIANELARKHLEIPACNSCLVAERTPVLEAAGFVDMVNCVFADESDVLNKLDHLFHHRDELKAITEAGRRLVGERHRQEHRDQLFQWYSLQRVLKSSERIVQPGPFMPLTVVDRRSSVRSAHISSKGVDRELLAEGDRALWSGNYQQAEHLYRTCLNYHEMPEPRLRLALCGLYTGRPEQAIQWMLEQINATVQRHEESAPDPVLWAYYLVALLCQGKLREACERNREYPSLSHLEYQRVRAVLLWLNGSEAGAAPVSVRPRRSVHVMPERSAATWLKELCRMLQACGQADVARRIGAASQALEGMLVRESLESESPGAGQTSSSTGFVAPRNGAPRGSVQRRSTRRVIRVLRRLKHYSLLPVHRTRRVVARLTGSMTDERSAVQNHGDYSQPLRELLRSSDVSSGLLIGACSNRWATETFLAALEGKPGYENTLCVVFDQGNDPLLRRRLARWGSAQCRLGSEGSLWEEVNARHFDAIVIDGANVAGTVNYKLTRDESVVVLLGINAEPCYELCRRLLSNPRYRLALFDPERHGGLAAFRKLLGEAKIEGHNPVG